MCERPKDVSTPSAEQEALRAFLPPGEIILYWGDAAYTILID